MTKDTIKAALKDGYTVINLTETFRERLTPEEWHILNLSGYSVTRCGNYLIIDNQAAIQLKDVLSYGAMNHNNLTEEERIKFGRENLPALRERVIKEAEEDGCPAIESFLYWRYWQQNGSSPSKVDIIKALCGQGAYADDMAEALTLGLLEDIARLLFDNEEAEITLATLNA